MGGSDDPLIGYMYYIGMHMVICHGPIDKLTGIVIDRKNAWSGDMSTPGNIHINQPNLFGGYDHEGGVIGNIEYCDGNDAQMPNTYLQGQLGSDIPAFRRVVSIILKQPYIGMSTYLKKWAFEAQRIHIRSDGSTQWYDAKAQIGDDMNPAHIIRECLTDRSWGMGYPDDDIDDTSFMAAADTLYTEGMGMSILWSKGRRLGKFIKEIQKHINASLYISREEGKFVLKLIRDDYVIDDLPILDQSSIVRVANFRRLAIADLTSEVNLIYTNRANGDAATVTARNIALSNQQGSPVGIRVEFKGFLEPSIAAMVAARELKGVSTPLATCSLYVNQEACNMNPGDPFKLTYEQYGINQMIMRVTSLEFGSITENIVKIGCVEDVFGSDDVSYFTPPDSGWSDIVEDAVAVEYRKIQESPYFDIARKIGDDDAQALDETACFFGITGIRPIGPAFAATMYVHRGVDYEKVTATPPVTFCPAGTLDDDLNQTTETFDYTDEEDTEMVADGTYCVIDDEIMLIVSHTTSSLTVKRGCSDTVPESHSAGERIWFCQRYFQSDKYEYADAESINVKLLTRTTTDELDIGDANIDNITFDQRQVRPYPPAGVTINTLSYPDTVEDDEDLVIAWDGRNRITQTAELVGFDDGHITPEAGTTYTVQVRDFTTQALIIQTVGTSNHTVTYTPAQIGTHERLTIQIKSIRDGYDSWQTFETSVGYGLYTFENGDIYLFEDGTDYKHN